MYAFVRCLQHGPLLLQDINCIRSEKLVCLCSKMKHEAKSDEFQQRGEAAAALRIPGYWRSLARVWVCMSAAHFATAVQSRHCYNEQHNDAFLDKQIINCLPARFYSSAREGSFASRVNWPCHRVGKPFFAPQCDAQRDFPSASQSSPKAGGMLNNMKGYRNTLWENQFTLKGG